MPKYIELGYIIQPFNLSNPIITRFNGLRDRLLNWIDSLDWDFFVNFLCFIWLNIVLLDKIFANYREFQVILLTVRYIYIIHDHIF